MLVDAVIPNHHDKNSPEAPPPMATASKHKVERIIVTGPTVYFPASNEWIHKFSWHGTVTPRGGSITGILYIILMNICKLSCESIFRI